MGTNQFTPDVLLLRSTLLWICSLFDIDDEFLLGLILVDGAGGIVNFVAVDVEVVLLARARA